LLRFWSSAELILKYEPHYSAGGVRSTNSSGILARQEIKMSSALVHRVVYTNGIRMHYVEQGQGPLVLLSHGWPECWYSWRHQIGALATAGFRVVAPDQRGFGLTDAPAAIEAYNVLELVGDLVGLVSALGESKATIIGHDWGSIVAANCALLRPDIFEFVGLMSVPYIPRQPGRPAVRFQIASLERNFYQAYFQEPDRVERELMTDVRRNLLGILYSASGDIRRDQPKAGSGFTFFDKATRFIDALVIPERLPDWLSEADIAAMTKQFQLSGFRGGINWYRNMDLNWAMTAFLNGAKIRQPAIFFAGSLDGVLAAVKQEYANLEAQVPGLTKKALVDGAGHWVQQEKPREVNELLTSFLQTCHAGA
jgi:pimeloyl-ACP methyl ester carboxylesterase